MTERTPHADRQLARDVAKQLDRRKMKRRMTLWSALLALVSAAALYLRCGTGFGVGGAGPGRGGDDGEGPRKVTEPAVCVIHVSPEGISTGGRPMSRDEAVAACRTAPKVEVVPTGDVLGGDVDDLLAALHAAGAKNVDRRPPPLPAAPPAAGSAAAPSAAPVAGSAAGSAIP